MGKLIDLSGKKFGRLTVLKRAPDRIQPNGIKIAMWYCVCDCPEKNIVIVSGGNLRSGHTTSCGCYNNEVIHN